MAARRPSSGGLRRKSTSPNTFSVGQKIEYYSKSYDEWIAAIVGAVLADGKLRLLHDDSTTLKEQADPSLVRPAQSNSGSQPSSGGRSTSRQMAAPAAKHSSIPSNMSSDRRPSAISPSQVASSPAAKGNPQVAGQRHSVAGQRPPLVKAGSNVVRNAGPGKLGDGGEPSLNGTINCKKFYVGDRCKIKDSGREGEVMYIGTPSFANQEIIGMRLDEKRSKSECDGKAPNGERLFRCPAGYGVFLPSEDVDVLPRQDAENFRTVVAPEGDLDLKKALDDLVGLAGVKQQLIKVRQLVEVHKKREGLGVRVGKPLHFGFRGNPGTGMSTVAKILAHLLRDLEVLTTGHLLEVSRKELLAGCGRDGDVEKHMGKVWKAAIGGVLLVNDAHALKDAERSRDESGAEVCEFLHKQADAMVKKCEAEAISSVWPQSACTIMAIPLDGQLPERLQKLGLNWFDFPDFSKDELADILVSLVQKRQFTLAEGLEAEKLRVHIDKATSCSEGDKNLRMIQRLLDEAIARQTERVWATDTVSLAGLTTLIEDDFVDGFSPTREDSMKAALAKVDNVVGLKGVKSFVYSLYAQLKTELERREAGIKVPGSAGTLHMVFSGNPGTGKTTVARIVAELLNAMGLLRKGHLVEADRGTLVAGYSGQTALKTRQVVEQAMGGVLFVDEAYALVADDGKDAFGHEALDTLIKMIEDRRQDLVVILAGYPDEMARLLASNPGVHSRFPVQVTFEDYSEEELMQIAEKMLLDDVLVLSASATEALSKLLWKACREFKSGREHGNGRAVRNILEKAKRKMAVRLQSGDSGKKRSQAELCTLEASDFTA